MLIAMTGAQATWAPVVAPQPGGPMHRYDVTVNGNKTTLLLSDADAKARGLTVAEAPAPAEVTTKAKTPANKSRSAATKRAEAAQQAFGAKAGDE